MGHGDCCWLLMQDEMLAADRRRRQGGVMLMRGERGRRDDALLLALLAELGSIAADLSRQMQAIALLLAADERGSGEAGEAADLARRLADWAARLMR